MTFRSRSMVLAVATAGVIAMGMPAGAQDKESIRWGVSAMLSGGLMLAPLLALDEEIQAKHGITLEMTDFNGNGTNCISAVIADAVDVCHVGTTAGMNAIAQGAEMVGIMLQAGQIVEITVSPAVIEKTGVGPDAPIADRVAALRGLRIASPGPGSTNYYLIKDILASGGMTLEDIVLQPLADIQAMNASLGNGRIDAGFWSVGGMSPSQASGEGVRYISLASQDFPDLRDAPNIAAYAMRDFVGLNHDKLRRVQLAFVDVVAKLKDDPVGYSQAYKDKYLPALPQETWANDVPIIAAAFYDDVEGTKEGWDFWIDRFSKEPNSDFSAAAYEKGYVRLSD